MTLPDIDRLSRLGDASLADLRAAFARHGYGEATTAEVDRIAAAAPGNVRLPIVRHDLLERSEPAFRLALLFTYFGPLPRTEVERHLGAGLTTALLDAGLLAPRGDGELRCEYRVVPEAGLWFVADRRLELADAVMPPGPTTRILERILPEPMVDSVIDVGCGPGSLALWAAAKGAKRTLGVDINPRAVAMARVNARWNALATEFRCGNLFEPAAGERFDLIVSQPPYVARPAHVAEVTFLHGGTRGDGVLVALLRGLGSALSEGGEALVLSDVPLRSGQEMAGYLNEALGEVTRLDDPHVLALHVGGPDVETHALLYTQLGSVDTGAGYVREVIAQRAHLGALEIERFRHTLFVARRAGPARRERWRTAIAVRELAAASAAARARLWESVRSAGEPDAALLGRRIRVAPDAQWVSLRRAPEGEQSEHRVRFGPGWPGMEQIVTDEGLTLASLLEREPSVEAAVAGYAELCEAKPAEVRAPLLTYIRQSLLNGMLVPEENGHGS